MTEWRSDLIFAAPLPPRTVVRNALESNGFGWIDNPALDPWEDWTKLQVLHRPGAVGSDNVLPGEFASYEFRKLLKHLIALRGRPLGDLDALAVQLGQNARAIEQYLAVLEETGWLNRVGDSAVFTPSVDDLGHTMESYVAFLFNRHLHWQATTKRASR